MDSYQRVTNKIDNKNFLRNDDSYNRTSFSDDIYEGGYDYRYQNRSDIDLYQGALSQKTKLVQLYTDIPEEAPRLISETRSQAETPLVVIINKPNCYTCVPCTWCTCMRNIPQ